MLNKCSSIYMTYKCRCTYGMMRSEYQLFPRTYVDYLQDFSSHHLRINSIENPQNKPKKVIQDLQNTRLQSLTSIVRKTVISRGNRSPINPPNTIVLWCSEGFQRGSELGPHHAKRRSSFGQLYVWSLFIFQSRRVGL